MRRRIALLMDLGDGYVREAFRGIGRFAAEHGPWLFHNHSRWAPLPQLLCWSGDGVIAFLHDQPTLQQIRRWGGPAIAIGADFPGAPLPVVHSEHRAIGELAARHLLERGVPYLAYCGFAGDHRAALLQEGFHQAVVQANRTCSVLSIEPGHTVDRWQQRQERIAAWLQNLPRPVGVMASSDMVGVEVLTACRQIRLRVPEDVAVLGTDNDELFCTSVVPALSSVAPDAQRIGYEAARRLDLLMRGETLDVQCLPIPPLGVVTRRSTDLFTLQDPEVVEALKFIQSHQHQALSVEQVVSAVAISRRSLERRFVGAVGRTIQEEIHRMRLQWIQKLLTETGWNMYHIAQDSGFTTPEQMATFFRRQCGQTPSQYRRSRQF